MHWGSKGQTHLYVQGDLSFQTSFTRLTIKVITEASTPQSPRSKKNTHNCLHCVQGKPSRAKLELRPIIPKTRDERLVYDHFQLDFPDADGYTHALCEVWRQRRRQKSFERPSKRTNTSSINATTAAVWQAKRSKMQWRNWVGKLSTRLPIILKQTPK